MIAYKKTKSDTLKDIRRLERNVRSRVENIEARKDLPQFGAESFRKFEMRVQNYLEKAGVTSISKLPEEQIEKISRDIRYLNQLKSTSVKGAELAKEFYVPTKERLDALSPEQEGRTYNIYDRVLSRFMGMENYKYEIQNYIVDRMLEGADNDSIFKEIFDMYDTTIAEYGAMGNEHDIALSFTSKLKEFSID